LYEVQVSEVEERTETSVEMGRRAAERAESRMLIDGELVAAASGEEYDNLSPATVWYWGAPAPQARTTSTAPSRPHGVPLTSPTGRRIAHCVSAASNSYRQRSKPTKRICARS
jgi:hypothetical protein